MDPKAGRTAGPFAFPFPLDATPSPSAAITLNITARQKKNICFSQRESVGTQLPDAITFVKSISKNESQTNFTSNHMDSAKGQGNECGAQWYLNEWKVEKIWQES